jgi:acetolactate synthase-1/2/3 large subunit
MARLTGGQALVHSLLREGVDTIFGIPGVQLDWAYNALYDAGDKIRVVHCRHEQATAYMADGYARSTGKVGVYLVVPGPGVLNTTAALSTAYACNAPVLCLTGQIQSDAIDVGRGLLHEIPDQIGLLRHLTKWAGSAMSPTDVPGLVHEAFRQMRSGRPRPTAIEIPPDVLMAQREVDLRDRSSPAIETGNPALLQQAAEMLGNAERPVIVAGGGVLSATAWEELRVLAELLEAPVVMTANGIGALPASHRLAVPFIGLNQVLADADALLAIGTRMVGLRNRTVAPPPGVPLIRIDADGAQFYRTTSPTVGIVADAKAALASLVDLVPSQNRSRPDRSAEVAARPQRRGRGREAVGCRRHGHAPTAGHLGPHPPRGATGRDDLRDREHPGRLLDELRRTADRAAAHVYRVRLPGDARQRLPNGARRAGRQPRPPGGLDQRRRRIHVQRPGASNGRPA